MPKRTAKHARQTTQTRLFRETDPLESVNEINGIVERFQWNRSTNSMALFRESASAAVCLQRFCCSFLTVCVNKQTEMVTEHGQTV
jgi:hypothetical protein